jgi:hypothetical protein
MPTNFPTGVDNFTNPTANDSLNLPSHSTQHANANDAIEAVEDYLLNGAGKTGLVLIKTQAVGTGASTIVVNDAFNATYENYRIIYSNGTSSSDVALALKFTASGTGYFGFLNWGGYTSSTPQGAADNNAGQFSFIGGGNTAGTYLSCDLLGPFLTKVTRIVNGAYGVTSSSGLYNGYHSSTVSYSSFTIIPASGTLTGGTVYVYGYKAA